CVVLGMGLPSIPAYIVTPTMAAKALTTLGLEPIFAHLIVFYFGQFSYMPHPLPLAAFAAAGISGCNAMRIGFAALILATAGFVIPFIFAYSPDILLRYGTVGEGVAVVATALIGILLLCTAMEQHFMVNMSWYLAIIMAIGAIMMLNSDMVFSILGAGIGIAVLLVQMAKAKKLGRLALQSI